LSQALASTGPLAAERVWDLARAPDGTVFAATGDSGKVFQKAAKDKDGSAWTLALDATDTQAFCLAAVPSGKVFAFEPDTWLVALLRKSCTRQPVTSAPVSVVPVAIAGTEGLRHFSISRRSRAASHLAGYGTTQAGGSAGMETVLAVSADWLLDRLPAPTVVKIDVEGAEAEVLSGARRIIEGVRPRFLVEVGSANAAEVADLFLRHDYELFDGERDATLRTPVTKATWATVAMPR